jgi:hypothetical protein
MIFTVRPRLIQALTLLITLAVYFQSIANPFSRFDDPFILEHFGINSRLSFYNVITPGSGFYYRPIVNLSYWLDFQWWGLDPSFMHLENIVAHLVNVFLVFLIASRLPVSNKIRSFPFLSALLFGLHPINSESVNWIAGRTDLFAGMFILCAAYFLIRAIQEQSTRLALFAFGVAFVGALAKETAIMFIPAAYLVFTSWPVVPLDVSRYRTWRTRFLLVPIVISACLIFSLLILVYAKRGGENAISMIFESGTNPFIRIFEALGFYVKKIFLPLPLNVAIREVDPLYAIVGILALCLVVVTIQRFAIPGIFLVSAVLFTLPALVVATTPIAWTPFGERYLYIPSAFAVIGCLELSHRFLLRWNEVKLFVPIVSVIIVIASIATFQRGILWGNNLALMEDIVAKSPNFGVARNEYGALLIQDRRYKEAEQQFRIALEQNNQDSVNRIIRHNLIGVKIHGKSPIEARRLLLSEIGNKIDGDAELLKLIYECEESILGNSESLENKNKIVSEMINTNESLYQKTQDSFYLYRSGQLALTVDNKLDAATYFRKAYENARPDAYYREPARKLAEKLVAK